MFRWKRENTKRSIDRSVNIPGRTSFQLSIKRLLPFEGKTILTLFAKPNQTKPNQTGTDKQYCAAGSFALERHSEFLKWVY